jgi:DNA polymerase-3 subunit alpha
MRYVPELYFKSAEKCARSSANFRRRSRTRSRSRTDAISSLSSASSKYPEYPVPEGKTREAYLRELCYKGLHERYGERAGRFRTDQAARLRSRHSRAHRVRQLFPDRLGLHHFAKQRGIPVGPGRGSAAGSMVAYVLGITDIDPLQFNLIFERFLNPERVSPPDIDVDFCKDAPRRSARIRAPKIRRTPRFADHHVWQTEREKRGARRRPRDGPELRRCRSDREDDSERAEHHAHGIRQRRNAGVEDARSRPSRRRGSSGTTRSCSKASRATRRSRGRRRDRRPRFIGIRAALPRHAKGSEVISQYPMGPLNDLGLLKMDFLGLKTLTVIEDT